MLRWYCLVSIRKSIHNVFDIFQFKCLYCEMNPGEPHTMSCSCDAVGSWGNSCFGGRTTVGMIRLWRDVSSSVASSRIWTDTGLQQIRKTHVYTTTESNFTHECVEILDIINTFWISSVYLCHTPVLHIERSPHGAPFKGCVSHHILSPDHHYAFE